MVKPHGLLVSVSSAYYYASTTHVWLDAGEIYLKLNSGSWSKFSKSMQYPMNHIGRRIVKRVIEEKRNMVVELWPEGVEVIEELTELLDRNGFKVNVIDLDCSLEKSLERHKQQEKNNISSAFTTPFHLRWLDSVLQ